MANIVPEKMLSFEVYINGSSEPGIAEGKFPSLEYMTSETKGAGLAGVVDSIVVGHFNSITASLTWRVTPKNFFELSEPRTHSLDFYAAYQMLNAGRGELETHSLHIYTRGQTKKFDFGNVTVGDSQGAETEHEIFYFKASLNGIEKIEIDKFNYICKINGKDYLAATRRALGRF